MNKKELAKLLFQTTEIKELFESQQFDTTTISKVIAQEIMREQEEGEQKPAPTLPELEVNLKFAMAQLKGYGETFAQKRNEYRVARTDGDSDTADDARFDMETIKTLIKDENEKIQDLSNKIDLLKSSAQAAAKTASQDDDQVVAAVAKKVGDEIKAAADLLSNNPEDNTNVAGQIAQSVVEPIKQAVDTVKKVTAAEEPADNADNPEGKESSIRERVIDANVQITKWYNGEIDQNLFSHIEKLNSKKFWGGKATGPSSSSSVGEILVYPTLKAIKDACWIAFASFGIENLTVDDVISIMRGQPNSKLKAGLEEFNKAIAPSTFGEKLLFAKDSGKLASPKFYLAPNKYDEASLNAYKEFITEVLQNAKQSIAAADVSLKPSAEQDAKGEAPVGDGILPAADTPPSTPPEPTPEDADESNIAKEIEEMITTGLATVFSPTGTFQEAEFNKLARSLRTAGLYADRSETVDAVNDFYQAVEDTEDADGQIDPEKFRKMVDEKYGITYGPEATPEPETAPEADAAKGWANSKAAARARVKDDTSLEQIQASLQSPEAFKEFWGSRGDVSEKMKQAQELFDDGYFDQQIQKLKEKAATATTPEAEEEIKDDAAELFATAVSFDQYLEELPDGYELPLTKNAEEILSFLPTTEIPTSPEDFKSKFLDPIDAAIKETAPEAVEDEEEIEETADVTAETEEVIENTPEADAEADGERPPPSQAEFDQKNLDLLKTFFGDNPQKSGFMKQFLLKNQAKMLVEMIDALNQIIAGQPSAGEDGEEERALTDDEPDATTRPAENPEGDADEVGEDDTEYIEEQVINEIFSRLFKNEDEEVEISSNGTKFMRQDLEAMVDLLRSLKKDIGKYEGYATRKSVNPSFNGSSLKEAMDAKLKVVQDAIAHLIKVIDNEIKNQREEVGNEEPVDESLNSILGENKSERKMKIEKVKEVYNEMRRMYEKGLKVSLEKNKFEKSKRGAEEIKDYVLSQKDFMGYFPRNVITSGGQVMTLDDAHKAMIEITGKFIETIRDVVTITRSQRVSFPNLVQATEDLIDISIAIESMFNVPSQIKGEIVDEFEEFQAENEDNVSLSDEPTSPSDEDAVGKSEEEMVKLVDFIKGMEQAEAKSTLRELGLRFDSEEEQDEALSVLVYYIYDTMGELKEVVGPSSDSKNDALREEIVSFLNKLKTATGMTDKMKDFVKTKQANLIKFLMSNAVKDLVLSYEEGGTGLMNQLKNLLTKNSPATKSVAKRMSSPLAPSPDADLEGDDGGSEEFEDGEEEGEEESEVPETDEGEVDEGPSEYDRKLKIANETRENYRDGVENTISKRLSNTKKVRGKPPRIPGIEGLAGPTAVMLQSFYAAAVIGADNTGMGDSNRYNDPYDVMPTAITRFTKEAIENTIEWIDSTTPKDEKDAAQREVLKRQNEANPEELVEKLRTLFQANNLYVQEEMDRRWEERTGNKPLEEALKPIINKMLKEHYNK